MSSILIVEDEGLIAAEIALRVGQLGHSVAATVDNAADAFECAAVLQIDMALVDINIKGPLNGIEIARRFRSSFDVPVIFLTAHADAATLKDATQTEPFGFLIKPFDKRALAAALATGLRRRHAEQQLAKIERWLAATMTSIGDGVIATDNDYRVVMINPVAERLGGWSHDAVIGKSVAEIFRIQDPAGDCVIDMIDRAVSSGAAINIDDRMLLRADGSQLPIDDTISPIRDEHGKLNGVVIVFRDATLRREHDRQLAQMNAELEEKVRRRTAQLEAANAELATFSYSIAHDLRAPLRAIIGFASRVVADHSSTLDPEGKRLLDVVTSRAGTMARMIDDYLRLSGLAQVGLAGRQLDMNRLAREAWAAATDGVSNPPVLEVECLPDAYGDESLIRQVWMNLLANAVKFTRTTPAARVRITGAAEDRKIRYCVEDNGIGFDPGHAAKLFRVFERLHAQAEFEGNGIGLCIVQRILHRHEGDIAIEGQPGKGARVQFWLPYRVAPIDAEYASIPVTGPAIAQAAPAGPSSSPGEPGRRSCVQGLAPAAPVRDSVR